MHKILLLALAAALLSFTNSGFAAQKNKKSFSKSKARTSKSYSPKKAKHKAVKKIKTTKQADNLSE